MKVKINDKIIDAKLPKAFKKQWITALRSGKYLQGKRQLGNLKEGFCCIGLAGHLCNIPFSPEKQVLLSKKETEFSETQYHVTNSKKIPKILLGSNISNKLVSKLTEMNDSGKWSFKRIASYVERYL